MFNRNALSAHQVRRVSVAAFCHERTVRSYLRDPSSVRSTSAERIELALREIEQSDSSADASNSHQR